MSCSCSHSVSISKDNCNLKSGFKKIGQASQGGKQSKLTHRIIDTSQVNLYQIKLASNRSNRKGATQSKMLYTFYIVYLVKVNVL